MQFINRRKKPHAKIGLKSKSPLALTIKETRIGQGLTQVELARRAGVSLIFLRELEQGKKSVRLDKVQLLTDFLGLKIKLVARGE